MQIFANLGSQCLEQQKRLSHFSNLQFLFDEMTCGTEWNLDFSRKIPPDFTERRSSGWIRYIPTMVCPFSGLLIEFSIFDTKWQEFNWKFGQYLQRWLAAPFSPAGFIEWWEIRNCGLEKGDPARNSGSRQAPIGGFTGRAKHFVNSEILTTSETMTFCQNKNNRSKMPTKRTKT